MDELAGEELRALPEMEESGPHLVLPRMVVGIGASAGGLESLEKLFQSLPPDTGMAFVVIQHLSPDFKSMMFELLSRDTRMPIHRAEDGMTIEANHVYLLPPKKEIIIAGGQLHLTDKDPTRGLTLPIDRFLESLAIECGPQSVAIILSGSGSDGSRGLREIAEAGGLVLCESPETAKFDGMPLSAHATGMVDHVLPPEAMGPLLAEHAKRPLKMPGAAGLALPGPVTNLRGLEAIFELFRREFDIDFSAYKDATILRRVSRRMMVSGASVIDDYARRLREDRTELNALYEDLLIGVTQFFRDEEVFDFLAREALPDLLRRRDPGRTLRVWVAGCGAGEEACSLAILLHECCEALGRPLNLKIFATDVHRKTLAVAGRGVFSAKSLEGLTDRRRDRYFVRKDELFQVVPELREEIVFASHNVLRDAPYQSCFWRRPRQPPCSGRAASLPGVPCREPGFC